MPRYKIIAGKVQHGGKIFEKDDVIEMSEELFNRVGRGKLVRVHESDAGFSAPQAAAKPRTPTKDAAATAAAASELGEDVTDEFEGAAEADLRVFVHNGWYQVAGADEPDTPLNEKGLRRADAESFVKEQIG